MTGKFIVIDGNDGAGKATQTELLTKHLARRGIESMGIDFPGYRRNAFGALIGECLAGKRGDFVAMDARIASALYALDRLVESTKLAEAIAAGKIVIADRFTSSNAIHQGGKFADETERISFIEWLEHIEHDVLKIPRPDAVVYLRVPLEVSLENLKKKRAAKSQALAEGETDMVEKDRSYLRNSIATADWLHARNRNWIMINCMRAGEFRAPEDISEEVVQRLGL